MPKTLSVRLDDNIKEAADSFFENYGLNTANAVKMFIYTTLKTKHFPFSLDFEPRQSLQEAINDTRNRTNLHGPFGTAQEAIEDMLRD